MILPKYKIREERKFIEKENREKLSMTGTGNVFWKSFTVGILESVRDDSVSGKTHPTMEQIPE